ncbi:uncharacterized protein BT62DRAFT_939278 [Guyanagaster necrorhizus]|uniref:Uncharacterized protein n=1 Tax=Guyanagaster necrorhizus TaxID=856835 RepID=A0A9P7VEV0_9AGAR|nr:uncharacterized protein BT62DRAFT_939278 [Guyanagaster necrorhizus MCA 3950]KAG7439110.1 hypothetical protein BT62DRAFT_939278 [Guyanagaster necrorhizus MCA 3950]
MTTFVGCGSSPGLIGDHEDGVNATITQLKGSSHIEGSSLSSSALFHYIAVHLVSSPSISVRFSLVQEDRVKTGYKTVSSLPISAQVVRFLRRGNSPKRG